MIGQLSLIGLFCIGIVWAGGPCTAPTILNGSSTGSVSGDSWTGVVSCYPGYSLVGSKQLKCRAGQWSDSLPVCADLTGCSPDDLPILAHGRKHSYQISRYRGGVYKYSCDKGYRRMGSGLLICGGGRWSPDAAPVCTRPGCDEGLVSQITDGQAVKKAGGAIFTFHCEGSGVLQGSSLVFCDGAEWNDTAPLCIRPTMAPSLSLEVPGNNIAAITPGTLVTVVCRARGGNPPPVLSLYKNNEPIGQPSLAENIHSFVAVAADNTAFVRCDAVNTAMRDPVQAEVALRVEYSPLTVKMKAPDYLLSGQAAVLECKSGASNPPAEIQWEVRKTGGEEKGQAGEVLSSSTSWTGAGWVTTSKLLLSPPTNQPNVRVVCTATNSVGDHSVQDMQEVAVHYPPAGVTIDGPQNTTQGATVRVQCDSQPSVPPAALHWAVVQDNNRVEYSTENTEEQMEDGSWRTRSLLEFVAGHGEDVVVECYARHQALGEDSRAFALVIVLDDGLHSSPAPNVVDIPPPEVSTVEDYIEYDEDEEELKEVNTSDKDEISQNVKDGVQMDESDIYILDILDTDPERDTIEGSGEKSENKFDVMNATADSSENQPVEEYSDISSHSDAQPVSSHFILLSSILQIVCRIFYTSKK